MPKKATTAEVRPSPNSSALAHTARTPCVRFALLRHAPCFAGDWSVFAGACHAEPLALGSPFSSSAGLASPAGPEAALRLLTTLGPSLRTLVTRNRWLLARPAAPPLVSPSRLVLKWLCACSQLSARPYARLSRGTPGFWLVLQIRRWSRAPVSLVHSLVTLLGPCAREFHWNSAALVQFHTRG
jgi:hypothetical protein